MLIIRTFFQYTALIFAFAHRWRGYVFWRGLQIFSYYLVPLLDEREVACLSMREKVENASLVI